MSYMKLSQETGLSGWVWLPWTQLDKKGLRRNTAVRSTQLSWSPLLFLKQDSLEVISLISRPLNRAVPVRVPTGFQHCEFCCLQQTPQAILESFPFSPLQKDLRRKWLLHVGLHICRHTFARTRICKATARDKGGGTYRRAWVSLNTDY